MKLLCALALLITAFQSIAVVTRHDVDSSLYLVKKTPDFYIDMPFEGGAALIHPQWLLAPAHVIYTSMYEYENMPIMVHGVENEISQLIIHPDYKRIEGDFSDGNPEPVMQQLNASKDIALIRLKHPVTHITPISIYKEDDELGMEITGFGRGAIGTGITGEIEDSEGPALSTYAWYLVTKFFTDWRFTQEDYPLRKYHNIVNRADGQWLRFTFDQGNEALPLEGTIGSGDSGGAAVIYQNSVPVLVGFGAWREIDGNLNGYVFGKHGSTAVLTRVSYFHEWIQQNINY